MLMLRRTASLHLLHLHDDVGVVVVLHPADVAHAVRRHGASPRAIPLARLWRMLLLLGKLTLLLLLAMLGPLHEALEAAAVVVPLLPLLLAAASAAAAATVEEGGVIVERIAVKIAHGLIILLLAFVTS